MSDASGSAIPCNVSEGVRCVVCNKKVRLLGYTCRCNQDLCRYHVATENHNCKFDHKAFHQEILSRNNPKIKADMIKGI